MAAQYLCKCGTELTELTAVWEQPTGGKARRLKPVCQECHQRAIRGCRSSRDKFYNGSQAQRKSGYGSSMRYNQGAHLGGDA